MCLKLLSLLENFVLIGYYRLIFVLKKNTGLRMFVGYYARLFVPLSFCSKVLPLGNSQIKASLFWYYARLFVPLSLLL